MTKWDSTVLCLSDILQAKSYMIQALSKTVREGRYGVLARCCRGLKHVLMMFITGPKL